MPRTIALAACLWIAAAPAMADGINEICLNGANPDPDVCDCAGIAIAEAFPNESIEIYEAAARNFFDSVTPDQPDGDWDLAYRLAAEETGVHVNEVIATSTEVAAAHRAAVQTCGAG